MPKVINSVLLSLIILLSLFYNIFIKEPESIDTFSENLANLFTDEDFEVKELPENQSKYILVDDDSVIIETYSFAKDVLGYGGPIILGLHISSSGSLLEYKVLKHFETPSWMYGTKEWRDQLIGKEIELQFKIIYK